MAVSLRDRVFRTIWLAQFVSVFGDFIAIFGVISRITFRLHGRPSDVALVMVAYMAPVTLVAPVAGVLVDRWPVKRVMIASDLIRAALAVSLVWAHTVPQIALVLALIGLVSSFFAPAQSVAIRALIPVGDLLSANALLAQAFYLVRIISPALAGLVVGWFGESVCFSFDGASFVFSASMIATLVIAPAASGGKAVKSWWRDFLEGNRFIFTHRELSFAFLSSCAAMFVLSSFSPLISVYIRDTLHAGPTLYGGISAMVGVGLIAGTQIVRGTKRRMEESVAGALADLLGIRQLFLVCGATVILFAAGGFFVLRPKPAVAP